MKPTSLNLYVLRKIFDGRHTVPNRIEAVDAPHLRRCIKLGLIGATKETLALTPAGLAVL